MSDAAIVISDLKKTYGGKKGEKQALKGVDLTIPKGSFFGLLGPNGAGKSTLINIMAGLVRKSSGQVSICGYDIDTDLRAAKYCLGVVPQELILDPFFPVREALENTAGYYGVKKADRKTDEIIKAVGLEEKANSPARSLSGGMRRRLLVAKALVHSPEVLILDEPTAGVDVELRNQLWDYVRQLHQQGTTIVLTTHYLEEAQELCDEIAVINHGKLIARDSKAKLMKTIDRKLLVITPTEPLKKIPEALSSYQSNLTPDGKLTISYEAAKISIEEILSAYRSSGNTICDLSTSEPDLEEVFLHLTR